MKTVSSIVRVALVATAIFAFILVILNKNKKEA